MTRLLASAFALVLLTCLHASAQSTADVATIDGIMRAYYEVVSGPAGAAPDRARDESLHMPGAHIGLARQTGGGTVIDMTTLAGYYERHGGVRKAPFYEWELSRQTRQFGHVAHVWSTYAVGSAPGGPAQRRGVTTLQLYFDGTRWWIAGWMSESELPARAIPPDLLPPASASTAGPVDDAAIREVVRRYVDAREARDPEAVAALFTPDADQLVSSGEWRRGRDVLVKGTMASSARNTGTRTIVVDTIRMMGSDVAIADARYEISGAETRKMWSTFVMARQQGQWRISAIRNMLPAPPAAATAPAAASSEQDAILAVVDRFMQAVSTSDAALFAEIRIPDTLNIVERPADGGGTRLVKRPFTPGEVKGNYRERFWDPVVHVRGSIAVVWTPYEFWRDGKTSHCGIDVFELAKEDGRWRIGNMMWTVEPDACPAMRPADSSRIRPQ